MGYIAELTDDLIKDINNETLKKLVEYTNYIALNDNEIFLTDELPSNFITIKPQFMLEKLKELFPRNPKSIYELENGDNYYYIDFYGKVESGDEYESESLCDDLLEIGNIFTTLDSAYDKLDKIKATEKVKKRIYELNDGWKPDWNGDCNLKYFFGYDYYGHTIEINCYYKTKLFDNALYLKSHELVKQLINELEKEIKIMLEVE